MKTDFRYELLEEKIKCSGELALEKEKSIKLALELQAKINETEMREMKAKIESLITERDKAEGASKIIALLISIAIGLISIGVNYVLNK